MPRLGRREEERCQRVGRVSRAPSATMMVMAILTQNSEIAMPPLSSLGIGQQQHGPPQPSYQSPQGQPQQFYQNSPAPVAPMSPPAEAHIQSWARNGQPPEQPQPRQSMPPLQAMWQPDMGIKFAPSPSAGASGGQGGPVSGGKAPVGGKWEPGAGIKFG